MIEIRHLCAGYRGTEVLHDIDAAWADGMLIGIVGPMGSGKSTLMKTVPAILPHTGGEICIDGRPLSAYSRCALARKTAYLSQGRRIPDMTAQQTVLHGRYPHLGFPRRYRECDLRAVWAAMELLGISSLADKPMKTLSGGMRQTVYLAMALAQDTQHILLDEPTTHLDIAHQVMLMRQLRSLADEGRCIAAVMHDLPLALTYADRILVLEHGRAAAFDTPAAVCASGILTKIFGVAVVNEDGEFRYRLRMKNE